MAGSTWDFPELPILEDQKKTFTPGTGGAGSPELAFIDDKTGKRIYVDLLPWCPLLGALGIPAEGFRQGAMFPSATSQLGVYKTEQLSRWRERAAAESAVRFTLPQRYSLELAIDYHSNAGMRIRDAAGVRGTALHDLAEESEGLASMSMDEVLRHLVHEVLSGRPLPAHFVADMKLAGYVRGLQKFFADHPGLKPLQVECTVFSRKYGVSGTFDVLFWWPGRGVIKADWKSSNFVLSKYAQQLAIYDQADYMIVEGRRLPVPKADACVVIHIGPGDLDEATGEYPGFYNVIPVNVDEHKGIKVVDVFHALRVLDALETPRLLGKPWEPNPDPLGVDDTNTPNGYRTATVDEILAPVAAPAVQADGERQRLEGLCEPASAWWVRQQTPRAEWALEGIRQLNAAFDTMSDRGKGFVNAMGGWMADHNLPRPATVEALAGLHATQLEELVTALDKANTTNELGFRPPIPPGATEADLDAYIEAQNDAIRDGLLVEIDGVLTVATPEAGSVDALMVAAAKGMFVGAATSERLIVPARRGRQVNPRQFGEDRDPAIAAKAKELRQRVKGLPRDLVDELDRFIREHLGGLNLAAGTGSSLQMMQLEGRVDEVIAEGKKRLRDVQAAIEDTILEAKPETVESIVRLMFDTVGAPAAPTLTERMMALSGPQALAVTVLCDGQRRFDIVACSPDEPDMPDETFTMLRPTDGGWWWKVGPSDRDLAALRGSKSATLAWAKELAGAAGRPKPRSTVGILADPLLVCLLTAGHSTLVGSQAHYAAVDVEPDATERDAA